MYKKKPAPKKSTTPSPLCPICAEEVFMGFEAKTPSPVLIITDDPEVGEKEPLSYPMQILRAELAREAIDMKAFDYVPLYRHIVPKQQGKSVYDKRCLEEHTKWLFESIIKHDIIFALGARCVKLLARKSVSSVTGLIVHSDLLSEDKILICCISPASAWTQTVGELRFAVQTFAAEYKRYEKDWMEE